MMFVSALMDASICEFECEWNLTGCDSVMVSADLAGAEV